MANTGAITARGLYDANLKSNGRIVVDMAKEIALLDPKIAPFVTILKRIKGGNATRTAYAPKVEWLEDDYLAYKTTTTADFATGTGTGSLAVTDCTIFRINDIVHIPATGENLLVTAITPGDAPAGALSVTRKFGTVAAASTASSGAEVYIIGNANQENASAPDRRSTDVTPVYNLTQIFRTPIELSNTEAASKLYGGKDRAYQRKKALAEHKRAIALAMYLGQLKDDQSSTRRTMKGLIEFIKNQSVAFAAGASPNVNLTYTNFNTYCAQPAFEHGSDEKLLICGSKLAAAIDGWDIANVKTEVGEDKTYGVHVTRLVTSYGILNCVYDPLLNNGKYAGYGLVLDMDNVRYVALDGRDTKLRTNIQAPDKDGIMDEYITECSLEVKNPKTHMLITGAYV